MKIIVESGATKTDWRLITDDGQVRCASGPGLNPSVLDCEQINRIIGAAVPQLNPEGKSVKEIFFYGAGIVSDDAAAPLDEAFQTWCPFARVEFHTDMLAAARALFADGSGVVAIMGTGSNSCLYENGCIVRNIRPGGYILGDEGSGATFGKAFLSDYVKGLVPARLEEEFHREFGLDYQGIVRKVYRDQAPSAFLASLAPFLMSHLADAYVAELLEDCLESFVRRSLARYGSCSNVGVVGSFGCACADLLARIGKRHGLEFTIFLKSPIDRLVSYHCCQI